MSRYLVREKPYKKNWYQGRKFLINMAWSMETNEKSIHNTQDQFNSSNLHADSTEILWTIVKVKSYTCNDTDQTYCS